MIINTYNRLWELPLLIAEKLNVAKPGKGKNWLTISDISGLLELSGFEVIKTSREVLFPFGLPLITPFLTVSWFAYGHSTISR